MAEKGTINFQKLLFIGGSFGWFDKKHQGLTVTKQTGTSPLVQSNQTQVLDNPDCRSAWGTVDSLGDLSLNLETDLYDLEGICENLVTCSAQT